MARLGVHPAPGTLGDLMPGWFAVPQNPMQRAEDGIQRAPTLGEILVASFAVPQNPVANFTAGVVPTIGAQPGTPGTLNGISTTRGLAGCGCNCGMGDISTDFSQISTDLSAGNFMNALSDPLMGFPLWGWLAAGAFAYMFLLSPSQGSSRVGRARKAYRAYANPRRRKARRAVVGLLK